MPACLCLSADTAASDCDHKIILALSLCDFKRLYDLRSIDSINKIDSNVLSIDCNLAVSIAEIDSCDGSLTATYAVAKIDILISFIL